MVVCGTDLSDAMDAVEMMPLRLLRKVFDKVLRGKLTLSETGRARLAAETTRLFSSDVTQQDLTVIAGVNAGPELTERAAQSLHEHGIVIVQGLIPASLARIAGEEVFSLISNARKALSDTGYYEDETLLAQVDGSVLQGYKAMADYVKPVLNMRRRAKGKQDGGMIDIFGFERILLEAEACAQCYNLLGADWIGKLVTAHSMRGVERKQLNVYCNESVVCTRGLHIDSMSDSYKVFLYLTDVTAVDDGPFLYVPGSYRQRDAIDCIVQRNRRYMNVASTDMHVDVGSAVKILGSAGTVVIACQRGVHGGLPQAEGGRRVVMVDNYYS